ncbi:MULTISPECIES: bifunctional phosphopantothenoylcysteine decarboxylase/phosphopantothenate--cysteine ligase CoaBC [unclassified Spirosoma]|uniref:bifunctional phosphopantothenoylcysteine decarboxylase/phosphopantothenate--cysteine ligase CoaBC n=1 Tax=unclassified Spirosoma TaxID=2621999 RepID=UPI000969BC30|nr:MULTISPECIES: bifunctional phosphopantothenoylcysteine decarboxylase/phosphopantothenate--cysteine ligase CoaBC [unclassified Spirosoma]MBN8821185.1 bifunctional phosphopantothenoylcysteine decarboxylase/phosphopantothenate--cysteine ligase CoaBC [Spirosoma sp.]OJW79184.1 MAG: phosphopantothenoylcysteine decarboxylase [Spirosoma sp. 48-14]
MSVAGKRILLGVTGSISAYKSALLTRLLIKAGAEVQVVMTESAKSFITPLTLATLSKRPVLSSFVHSASDQAGDGHWNNHVELGLWADVIVIAPASARTLARCATGLCDDLLSAIYLSARCPVFFAPAMDVDMYHHPTTVENLRRLESFGNHIIQAEHGELASGLVGEGRLAEPEAILNTLEVFLQAVETSSLKPGILQGKKVLVTAGPTQEPIDPVRYISNHSTGKMGYAIAKGFAMAGADVTLVSGPTALPVPATTIERISVRSAQEMYNATQAIFSDADIVILSAAVADYTPAHPADKKIKKKESTFSIELTKTIDIAATLGNQKQAGQLMMGFALETDNELENAIKKLHAKNLDWIVLNSLRDPGAGFGHDTNKITVIDKDNQTYEFALKSKDEVAQDLVRLVVDKLNSL